MQCNIKSSDVISFHDSRNELNLPAVKLASSTSCSKVSDSASGSEIDIHSDTFWIDCWV